LEDWQQLCTQEGIGLNKNVITEFKRRIKEAGLVGTAAHLDLRNGLLNARQISLLILVLSKKPIISWLEFRAEEVTNEALEAIEYVLQLQIRRCRDIDLDNRLQACYLGDIILEGRTLHLDQLLLSKVQQSCAILKYANARAYIRATYLDDNASAQSKVCSNSYLHELIYSAIFSCY
jgi:SOS-response transcriptional repressor LexA